MAIYNLSGKADIWWQDLKRVKAIKEKEVNQSTFKRYFKNKFLSEQYYEERAKEFSKCDFFKDKIQYLGHIVTKEGIYVDPEKIRAIEDWPVPKDVTDV